jgi:hypothetical protein
MVTWQQMRQQREQQQEPMRQQRVLLQARERQRVLLQARELLLSCHKRPERRQQSRLPKREFCSFLKGRVS